MGSSYNKCNDRFLRRHMDIETDKDDYYGLHGWNTFSGIRKITKQSLRYIRPLHRQKYRQSTGHEPCKDKGELQNISDWMYTCWIRYFLVILICFEVGEWCATFCWVRHHLKCKESPRTWISSTYAHKHIYLLKQFKELFPVSSNYH